MMGIAVILLWLILFVLFWPLALVAIVLVPVFWVLLIPFRLLFWLVEAILRLAKSILFLPARLLGYRESAAHS